MIYRLEDYYYNGYIVPMEFWKPITDEMVPGVKPIYYISNIGNIYNSELGRYSSSSIKPNDYIRVILRSIDGKQISTTIHRLVCLAFKGLPPNPGDEVDHINCDRTCSFEGNLEYVSKKENNRRAVANDRLHVGEDNYRAILTNDEVREICEMLSQGVNINEICSIMENKILPRKYAGGLSSIIYQILKKHIWKSISKNYSFHDYSMRHLSDEQIHLVCKSLEEKRSYDYIIDNVLQLNCDMHKRERLKETFYNIKRRKSFTDVSSGYNF